MSAQERESALIEALLDGQPIDWEAAGDAEEGLREALHTLEEVRSAYRRIGASGPAQPALFHWGPLAVLEKLGEGASAEVYRAWDPGLATMVALKLLRPEAAAAGLRSDEFLQEARLLAKLAHRNVLRVYGAAVHDGRPGLWAEWIEGRTLADIVATDGPLAAAEATHVGLELCAALATIHAAGLVHGDVKASNVLRARGGRIVLADLGAGGTPAALNSTLRTQATPAYLSPQVRDGAPRSTADDLYALGVLLHYLLSGEYPQKGAPGLRARLPELEPRLAAVVERACNADAGKRYASVQALADALRACTEAGHRPARPRRAFLPLAAAALATLVGIGLWQMRPAATGPWQAEASLLRLGEATTTLRDGDALALGDRLELRVSADRPTWAWVLNEDAEGAFHVLFPIAGLAQGQPARARRHESSGQRERAQAELGSVEQRRARGVPRDPRRSRAACLPGADRRPGCGEHRGAPARSRPGWQHAGHAFRGRRIAARPARRQCGGTRRSRARTHRQLPLRQSRVALSKHRRAVAP